MKLHTAAVGDVSAVVLDQHRGMHRFVAATTDELWDRMKAADPDADAHSVFSVTETEWTEVVSTLFRHGAVHVETEFDCDLVITRHLR